MSARTIQECDRHHGEITRDPVVQIVIDNGPPLDLCSACAADLKRFMDGEALEVPP